MANRLAIRSALLTACIAAGCQSLPEAPPAEGESQAVIRGQGPTPPVFAAPYLAPGEISCETPPPLGIGYEYGPPAFVYVDPAQTAAPASPTPAEPLPGWWDVLPPDGGPISDDFGLPTESEVGDRLPNPLYVRVSNQDAAWDEIARVVSRYFPILREERVRQTGVMLTEGRIETRWQAGSTILEPWRRDSAGAFNRWQSTLQSIRRRALLRVTPAAGGYQIGVRVEKQLEDLNRPERATAGAASLRNDSALPTDRVTPIDPIRDSERWIALGRDPALEQRIIKRLAERFGATR